MECCSGQLQTPSQSLERKTKGPCKIPCSGIEIGGGTTSTLGRAILSLIDSKSTAENIPAKRVVLWHHRRSRRGRGIGMAACQDASRTQRRRRKRNKRLDTQQCRSGK